MGLIEKAKQLLGGLDAAVADPVVKLLVLSVAILFCCLALLIVFLGCKLLFRLIFCRKEKKVYSDTLDREHREKIKAIKDAQNLPENQEQLSSQGELPAQNKIQPEAHLEKAQKNLSLLSELMRVSTAPPLDVPNTVDNTAEYHLYTEEMFDSAGYELSDTEKNEIINNEQITKLDLGSLRRV